MLHILHNSWRLFSYDICVHVEWKQQWYRNGPELTQRMRAYRRDVIVSGHTGAWAVNMQSAVLILWMWVAWIDKWVHFLLNLKVHEQ